MKIKLSTFLLALVTFLFALSSIVSAQYRKLLDFTSATTGENPNGNLIRVGAFLYGMTYYGGANDFGTIYKIKPDGSGKVDLFDFALVSNGTNPTGSLFFDGAFLYGTTIQGGANHFGVIFKIKPDGTGYLKLLDFAGATNGGNPQGALISDGTFLYGTASYGGANNFGVLFKLMPDGTGFTKLFDFSGSADGVRPCGTLFYDGTFLYGMATYGGTNNLGTLFKLKPDGTTFSKLVDFSGLTNGSKPFHGDLISDGTFLYGMTNSGGLNNNGVVFKVMNDGTGFVDMYDFSVGADGQLPYAALVSDGTFLYGMTTYGGTSQMGSIFRIKADGTGYSKLLDFTGLNGSSPTGSLFTDTTYLYGMTSKGGANNEGTTFKIMSDGTGYVKIIDFENSANGTYPNASLMYDGTFLYGTTHEGGANGGSATGYGTIFKMKTDSTNYSKLFDFSGVATGNDPWGSLISDGAYLYGTTHFGGLNSMGTLFKIKPDGTGYVKLLDFAGAANGEYPDGDLVFDGTFLYGTTEQGGSSNMGVVFKIMPDGSGYSKLFDFTGVANGMGPMCSLFFDGTFLYGTTRNGGANSNSGVLFKIMPDGSGYSKLLDFNGAATGANPDGNLISDGTFLYGMTSQGGTNSMGVIFKIMPDGSGFTKILDFAGPPSGGSHPLGSLLYTNGYLYGMAYMGGASDFGGLFKIKTDGTSYTQLMDFSGATNGSQGSGSLICIGNVLYGMTLSGGKYNKGTLFSFQDNLVTAVTQKSKETSFAIYPNPSNGSFILEIANPEAKQLQICDITGREMYLADIRSEKIEINLTNFAAGTYNIRLKDEEGSTNKRIVIMK